MAIFRAGTHRASNGLELTFTEADLEATARAYDPAVHEAPLVIGHPTTDAPAWGWVARLDAAQGVLRAHARQVDPTFAEAVRAGRYKRISASFYLPDAPTNPVPGVYYLRHVGFLGAAPPAVKGLPPAQFAADEQGVVEFCAAAFADDATERGLFERFLRWMLQAAGPAPQGGTVEHSAPTESSEEGMAQATWSEREEALRQREAELAARAKALAAREAKLRRAEAAQWAEARVAAGRLLPRERDEVIAFVATLPDEAVEFAEGRREPPAAWFRRFVEALPSRIDYAERSAAKADDTPAAAAAFATPGEYDVDADKLALHGRALTYMRQHKVDYVEAVKAVTAQGGV